MSIESFEYQNLTTEAVLSISPKEAEITTAKLIAQRARIRGGGQILSWGDFNENPDPLINQLLAILLVNQVKPAVLQGKNPTQIAVLSIENSAGYLASEIAHEIQRKYDLARPPRIIRARKTPDGSPPSPAMGEIIANVTVILYYFKRIKKDT